MKGNTGVSSGETPIPIPIPIHTIHTYNTYIHTYQQSHAGKLPDYHDFISIVEKQRKKHVTTTFPPLLWDMFRECVSKREKHDVKANHLLEAFMKNYIKETFIQLNGQVKITQFFQQVNITHMCNKESAQLNKTLGMVLEQWQEHPDPHWRSRWLTTARKHPELENAKRLLAKELRVEVTE